MVKYLREDNANNLFGIYSGNILCGYNGDKNITSITIPEQIIGIEAETFNSFNCVNLKSIKLSSCLQWIGYDAFKSCVALETITIPRSVTCLDHDAFACCRSLRKVNILSDKLEVGRDVFRQCPEDMIILYKGLELSICDFETAFDKSIYEIDADPDDYERTVSIDYVVLQHNKRIAMQKQDEADISRGLKPDSYIADENDWGF